MSPVEQLPVSAPDRIFSLSDIASDISGLQVGDAVIGFENREALDSLVTTLVYASLNNLLRAPVGDITNLQAGPVRVRGGVISTHTGKRRYPNWPPHGNLPSEELLGEGYSGKILDPQVVLLDLKRGVEEPEATPSEVLLHLSTDVHVTGAGIAGHASKLLTAIKSGRGRHKTVFTQLPDHTLPQRRLDKQPIGHVPQSLRIGLKRRY